MKSYRFLHCLASSNILKDPLILLSIALSILALKSILAAQLIIILQVSTISACTLGANPSPSLRRSPCLNQNRFTLDVLC